MYGIQRRILSEKFRQQCGEMEAARTDSSGNTGKLFHKIKHCRFCGCDYDVGVIWLWTGDGNAVKKQRKKSETSKKIEEKRGGLPVLGSPPFCIIGNCVAFPIMQKSAPRGSHCGGIEICRFATRRRRESCGAGFYFCFTSFYFKL